MQGIFVSWSYFQNSYYKHIRHIDILNIYIIP